MDIQRQAFENLWLAGGGSFDNLIFSKVQGRYIAIENSDLTDKQKEMSLYIVNSAYLFFIGGFKQAAKAQAVPEGFVLVPKEPTDKTIARMINTPIEVNLLCDHADIFLSEGEAYIAYQAIIEAQEPTND